MRAGTGRAATLPAAVVIGRPGSLREEAARRLPRGHAGPDSA